MLRVAINNLQSDNNRNHPDYAIFKAPTLVVRDVNELYWKTFQSQNWYRQLALTFTSTERIKTPNLAMKLQITDT